MHADAEKQFCKRACEAFVVWGRGGVVLTFLRRRSEAVTGNGNQAWAKGGQVRVMAFLVQAHSSAGVIV